jgi:hypothetical protein
MIGFVTDRELIITKVGERGLSGTELVMDFTIKGV